MSNDSDSDLRRLLDDAVSDVHPEGSAEEIRSRAAKPSATRWVPITVAAAVATVLVIGGGAWLAQRSPSPNPPAAADKPASDSQAPAAGQPVDVTVYFVGATAAGARLFPETRHVDDATDSPLQVAVNEALTGSPKDPDYDNPFKELGVTATAAEDNGTITIDLSRSIDNAGCPQPASCDLSKDAPTMFLQSLVRTADAATGTTNPVAFTVDGHPVQQLLGIPTSTPVAPASDDSVLSTVLIDSPTQGATVPTQFKVEGRASTFEANVVWELKQGDKTVRNGFTTAHECCTLSPYSFTVTAPPGDYTLVVHDTDESDGEGIGTSQDTKAITIE